MKTIIWAVVILLVLVGIYIYFKTPTPNEDLSQQTTDATTNIANQNTGVMMEDGTLPESTTAPTAKTVSVTYIDAGFSPKSVEINAGDTVKFVNGSSGKMWVASAAHPTHTAYDGTNLQAHCASGATPTFDQCKGEVNGASYSFIFTKVGTWNYHDHLTSSHYGSVVVK